MKAHNGGADKNFRTFAKVVRVLLVSYSNKLSAQFRGTNI